MENMLHMRPKLPLGKFFIEDGYLPIHTFWSQLPEDCLYEIVRINICVYMVHTHTYRIAYMPMYPYIQHTYTYHLQCTCSLYGMFCFITRTLGCDINAAHVTSCAQSSIISNIPNNSIQLCLHRHWMNVFGAQIVVAGWNKNYEVWMGVACLHLCQCFVVVVTAVAVRCCWCCCYCFCYSLCYCCCIQHNRTLMKRWLNPEYGPANETGNSFPWRIIRRLWIDCVQFYSPAYLFRN